MVKVTGTNGARLRPVRPLSDAMKDFEEPNISNTKAVIIVTLSFVCLQFYIVPLSVIAWQWWFN